MYEMMKRSDATVKQLPLIIAKLQSLKPVHGEASSITQTIKQLQNQQEVITTLLKSHNGLLDQVHLFLPFMYALTHGLKPQKRWKADSLRT